MENTTSTKRGRPSTKNVAKTKEVNYEEIIKSQNDTIENLKKMIEELAAKSAKDVQPVSYSSMMDKPCTLIHLWDCVPGLPTTIFVRDIPYQFSSFGEKRKFRFEDIQLIVSKYRNFFERGVFTLGSDCDEFKEDFGVDFMEMPMSASKYKHIASLPIEEFQNIVHNINKSQKIILAKTWVNRYNQGIPEYDDMNKISIINKETDGFLNNFIERDMRRV